MTAGVQFGEASVYIPRTSQGSGSEILQNGNLRATATNCRSGSIA